MKVSPGQQQLILASEYLPTRRHASALDDVLSAASQGATLKHLTVLASRPDSTVVWLHADYDDSAPANEAANDARASSTTNQNPASNQSRSALVKLADQAVDRSRGLRTRGGGIISHAELAAARYAENEGTEGSRKGLHIDVHA